MPLVILQATLGKPATTLTTPSPLWYRLLLVVVLRLLEDVFFLLDLLGMLVLNEDSSRDVIFLSRHVMKSYFVVSNVSVVRGRCEIRHHVVQRLHLSQKPIQFLHSTKSVVPDFCQRLFVRRVSELGHVHLERILLEIVPSFQ